jgi:hypothetical protein
VKGAWLDNGLLHIDLVRPQPETRVRTIEIGQNHAGNGNGAARVVEAKREG